MIIKCRVRLSCIYSDKVESTITQNKIVTKPQWVQEKGGDMQHAKPLDEVNPQYEKMGIGRTQISVAPFF